MTALEAARTKFLFNVLRGPPRALKVESTIEALRDRSDYIEQQIIACREWLAALVEDTAPHLNLPRRTADYVTSHMDDAAGDVRGDMLKAIESMEEERV